MSRPAAGTRWRAPRSSPPQRSPSPSRRTRSPTPRRARSRQVAPSTIDPSAGIGNIDHIVVIVQENRSFDHYFGTFPGADGIPRLADGRFTPCIPDPASKRCRRPYRDTNLFDEGGPHNTRASKIAVDGGRMDGFVEALREIGNSCGGNPQRYQCAEATARAATARPT